MQHWICILKCFSIASYYFFTNMVFKIHLLVIFSNELWQTKKKALFKIKWTICINQIKIFRWRTWSVQDIIWLWRTTRWYNFTPQPVSTTNLNGFCTTSLYSPLRTILGVARTSKPNGQLSFLSHNYFILCLFTWL